MIQVRKLSKYYGNFAALKEVSFTAKAGEVVGLLGLNGAGKTTCLRILSGYLIPSSGNCLIDNKNIFSHPLEVKSKIGYLPETPPLYHELNVESYLLFVARMRGLKNENFPSECEKVAALTNIEDVLRSPIRNLSLGYRKRLGIAQTLIASPSVLILDEPITGLDPVQILEMRKLIRKLAGKYTILISSHILTEVSQSCDKVIIIHKGSLAKELDGNALGQGKELEEQFIEITRVAKEAE